MTSKSNDPPTLRFPLASVVTPGDRLGTIRQDLLASSGTYVHAGHLYANVAGCLTLDCPQTVKSGKSKETVLHPTRVVHPRPNPPRILTVGKVILGKVMRLSIQQAFVDILAEHGGGKDVLPSTALSFCKSGEGVIRREDVRAGATEQVNIHDMFRPGDLVLCRILSLGDRRYLLGTAEPALGIVLAYSETSHQPMIPLSWKEMQCPISGHKESRKCAKPPNLSG